MSTYDLKTEENREEVSEDVSGGPMLPPTAHIPIESILAHPHNWHVHPESQLQALEASMDEFGPDMDAADYNTRTGHLLDGHARMEILRRRGKTTLYCQIHDLSEEDEARWLLTKDKTASMAETDDTALKLLLSEYAEEQNWPAGWDQEDFDALVKAGEAEQAALARMETFPDPDETPTFTRPGDIWRVGPHIFGCLNSEDTTSVYRMLEAAQIKRIDQIFTDPPYEMETSGGAYKTDDGKDLYNRSKLNEINVTDMDHCDPESEFLPTLPAWFGWGGLQPGQYDRLNVFVYCTNTMQLPYMRWASSIGALWDTLMWDKQRGDPLGGRHERNTEYLVWLKYRAHWTPVGQAPHANRKRILTYALDPQQEACGHPTPKSPDLAANEMQLTTRDGDWIADPYGGTGAHAIAAAMTGRNAIYMDTSPKWCDFAMRWMELITGEAPERIRTEHDPGTSTADRKPTIRSIDAA